MTPSEAVAELDRAVTVLGELPGDMIDAAIPAAKTAILDHVASARGGSLTLSGMGATLGIDDTIEEGDTTASAKLTAVPAGPWSIVESGTKAHEQNRRGGRGVSRAMPTPYGYYSKVMHPGAAGIGVWDPATAAADQAVDQAVRDIVTTELPRHH